jgi:hypothetical protein
LLCGAGVLLVVLAGAQVAGAQRVRNAVGTRLEQCENGTSGVGDCTGSAWITGALNSNKALYREGDFVPLRVEITGLSVGTDYTLRIGYDAVENDLHGYDYLGSFDASENAPGQSVVPCDGIAGTAGPHACGTGSTPGAPSTLAVPTDTNTQFPSGSQVPGVFSAWGGQLKHAGYVSPTPIDVTTTGNVAREIDVTFTADGDTVVLAWGGHIASSLDWGAGNTYVGSKSGASLHMMLGSTDSIQAGTQSLAIHGDVIALPPSFSTQVQPSQVAIGAPVIDTATLSGTSGHPPSGSVAFFACFDTTSPPNCSTGGTAAGQSPVIVSRPPAGSNGVASVEFVPDTPGFYCFRAEYTPSVDAPYSPGSHTNTTTECFQATLPPPLLTVTKLCVPTTDTGLFNLLIDNSVVFPDAPCSGSTGPLVQSVGPHTVSETAGTNTSLTNYVSMIGGDCATNGTVTLAAGQSATCTITNERKPPPPTATLTVNKVCEPASDPGRFDFYIDSTRFPDVACGGTTGPVTVAIGAHTVSEQNGTDTSLTDYTSVIGGDCGADGTITLAANQSATCTITNTRKPTPPATITVTKACLPADDPGHFNLTIDGHTAGTGTNVACGGTTGAVTVHPGLHTVGETAGSGTDLGNYTTVIGGDCATDGSVLVAAGDQATCTISNVRRPPTVHPFAILTVNKICVPASDGGLFNLSINANVETNEPCGGSIGPLAVPVGAQQVGETAGTGTSLANYTTVIGGACAADGTITLSNGESAICTITNERKSTPTTPPTTPTEPPITPPTATIEIKKICVPANIKHHFTLILDTQPLPEMTCGESTGPIQISTGPHLVEELRPGTNPGIYKTVIGGACAANGTLTLTAGQAATCTITNTRVQPPKPPQPPTECNRLAATPRTLTVGKPATIIAHVAAAGRPVLGARITLTGPGIFHRRTTTANGTAHFAVKPTRSGILTLSTQRQYGCREAARDQVGVTTPTHKTKPPAVTG